MRTKNEEGRIRLDQQEYIEKMVIPEKTTTFKGGRELTEKEITLYSSEVGKLNWLSQQTIPDLAFDVSSLSQTCKGGTTEDMRRLISIERKTTKQKVQIGIQRLNKRDTVIEVFSDASLGNIRGEKTQIGYYIQDDEGNSCPVMWKSKVTKRIT